MRTPTQADYDRVAKAFQLGKEGDIEGWDDLAIDPEWTKEENLPVQTADTLENFRDAAKTSWREASGHQEVELEGAIYWESVQVKKGDRRESLVVVDFGDFRLCYMM